MVLNAEYVSFEDEALVTSVQHCGKKAMVLDAYKPKAVKAETEGLWHAMASQVYQVSELQGGEQSRITSPINLRSPHMHAHPYTCSHNTCTHTSSYTQTTCIKL